MFSDLTIHSVNNLFNAPGLGLELAGASMLAIGVAFYLARVAWISLSHARRMEQEALHSMIVEKAEGAYTGPYCAG